MGLALHSVPHFFQSVSYINTLKNALLECIYHTHTWLGYQMHYDVLFLAFNNNFNAEFLFEIII